MILPPPSPSPVRGVVVVVVGSMGDAVEMVFGYLFLRRDCLAVRESAPEGAWLGFARAGLPEGGMWREKEPPGVSLRGWSLAFFRSFLLTSINRTAGRVGGLIEQLFPPVRLKPVFILGTGSSVPFCSRPRVEPAPSSPRQARYRPGLSEACLCTAS